MSVITPCRFNIAAVFRHGNNILRLQQVPKNIGQRLFSAQPLPKGAAQRARGDRAFSAGSQEGPGEMVSFTFVEARTGDRIKVQAKAGKTVLETAIDNNVDIEGEEDYLPVVATMQLFVNNILTLIAYIQELAVAS